MTKEQLIERLSQFVNYLDNDKTLTDNSEEIKEIEKSRQKLIFEANLLERKLQDDSNYQSFNYIKNQSKKYDYEVKIASLEQNQLQIKADTKNDNYRLNVLEVEISSTNSLLSQEQKELEELGVAYRALGENPTKDDEEKITSRMQYHRENITWLMSELNNFTKEQDELRKTIEENNKRLEELDNYKNRYQVLLDEINENDLNDTKIDQIKKENDERKLLELKALINSFNHREDYLSFNLSLELFGIINELENDNITTQEALDSLKDIKSNIPSFSVTKDYSKVEEELETNRRMQAELSAEKAHLEEKLSDEQNYTSIFASEMVQQDIKELENKISRYDSNIASIEAEIANISNINKANDIEIINLNAEISKLEIINDEIRLRSVLLSNVLTDQGLKVLEKEKSNNKKEIDKLKTKIERIQKSIVEAELIISLKKKYIKSLEVIKNKDVKDLASKKELLNDNIVDKNAIVKDQLELEDITKQIQILKNNENNITFDYEEELDKLITELEKTNEANVENTVREPEKLEPEFDDFYPIDEIKEKNLPVLSIKQEIVKYGDDDIIPVSFWKKAKDKVLEKLKDKVFVRRVKAGFAALLVSFGIGYGVEKMSNTNELPNNSSDAIYDELPEEDTILKPIPGYPDIDFEDETQIPEDIEQGKNETPENNELENDNQIIIPGIEEPSYDNIILSEGETFITTLPDGNTIMVDNSNGNNNNVIPPNVDNYNDLIKAEEDNDKLNISVPTNNNQEELFSKATDEVNQDYLRLLEELGISAEETVEMGRNR